MSAASNPSSPTRGSSGRPRAIPPRAACWRSTGRPSTATTTLRRSTMKPPPLTSSAAGSHVRTSASPAPGAGSTASAPASGESSRGSFALSHPGSSSSRTSRRSRHAGSTKSYEILPKSGSMRNGQRSARLTSEPRTDASDSSCWPTPTASDYGSSQNGCNGIGGEFERPSANTASLSTIARNWPTQTAGDAKASGSRNLMGSNAHLGLSLRDAVTSGTSTVSRRARPGSPDGMVLNPLFVEALMGLPGGWTCLCATAAKQVALFEEDE